MKFSSRIVALTAVFLLTLTSALIGLNLKGANAQNTFPSSYFAPYQDITIGPSLQSVTQSTGQKYYTLAFISSNGCNAEWAGTIPLNQTSTYLPHLDSDISYIRSQGGDVIISFGGAAGQELAQACGNASSLQAQYQAVINQYNVTHLDFDIEGGAQGDSTSYDRRNLALAALQQANPGLVISFTLPSATTGLLSDSLGLLNNAVSHGVNFSVVNLMTMDYGSADSQMGQEAINAANGLYSELQNIFPSKSSSQLWSMVGITPMIGQNDSGGEIFSLSNAQQVLSFAQQNHIGELAFWEISRDNGNCAGSTTASDSCSGISQNTYDFTNAFKPFTSGSSNPTPTPTPNTSGSYAVNAGGSAVGSFQADNYFSGGTAATTTDTIDTSGVSHPAPQAVYQSERYGNFPYTFPNLQAGTSYTVRLHFAEFYWSSTGQRVFNVSINGSQVLSNFDIIAATGAKDRAIVKAYTANADSTGKITIQFTTVIDNAKASGIEVSQSSGTPTPTPTATPTSTPTATPTPTGGNLVANPGFETGNLSSWSCDSNDIVVSSPVHSGSHALQVTPTSSTTGECDQTITVQANHTYTLSAYVNGSYAYIGIQNGASNWTSSSSYTKLSVTFTTSASQTSITIFIHGWYAQGNVYADDFSLQ